MPPVVEPQSSRFWQLAAQSGLVDVAALEACWADIPEAKRTADAIDRRLARQAVNAGLVTVWQAQQLLAGRAAGFKIDRYVLRDLIGQGGMGRVYLAQDTRLGRKVALKVLSRERMSNPRAIARFQREAKVGAQLQHENLVRIYDEGESTGIRYLVMEYIAGKNVAQLIGETGAIPWPAAADLARQVALGLDHAQRKGLIHRDVNPSNILVTHDGTAKLTDLGLAIDLAEEANVTRDGATVGTFDYISPEQAKHSREVDTRSDIYSLGCTLYHMIAGQVPFPVPSLPEKLYAHQLHDATPLDEAVPGVPAGLARVVQSMMRKAPEQRYQTPQALAEALEPFAGPTAEGAGSAAVAARASSGSQTSELKTRVAAAVRAEPEAVGMEPRPADPIVAEVQAPVEAGPGLGTHGEVGLADPDLGFFAVDTGPESSLSEGLAGSATRGKIKPKSKSKSTSVSGVIAVGETARAVGPGVRPWMVVAAGLVVVAVAVVAIAGMIASRRKSLAEPRPDEVEAADRADRESNERKARLADRPAPGVGPAIAVVDRDGQRRPVETLAEAVAIALGAGSEVVLNPSGVFRLSASEVRVTRGALTIRAAEGATPVVAIDGAGARPMLLGTAGTSIRLVGLRLMANHGATERPAPLIESGGSVTIDRSILIAEGATGGSRAVLAEGPKLTVTNSLLVGFDRALDVQAYPGSEVIVRRSMIVRSGGSAPASAWAVRVGYAGSGEEASAKRPRRVVLDHATIVGAGLLEISGFPPGMALAVEVDRSAIQARSLLAFAPMTGESPAGWSKGVAWTGKGNRFDVTGSSWVVLSAAGEFATPDAPTDLDGWRAAVGSDKDSEARSFRLPNDRPDAPAGLGPADFAPTGDGLDGVGADPKAVGPKP